MLSLRAIVVALLAVALSWFPAGSALACSCVQSTVKQAVGSDGAVFVGDVAETKSGARADITTFRVSRDLEDQLSPTVDVHVARDTCSVSFDAKLDEQVAMRIYETKAGGWTTNMCLQLPVNEALSFDPAPGLSPATSTRNEAVDRQDSANPPPAAVADDGASSPMVWLALIGIAALTVIVALVWRSKRT